MKRNAYRGTSFNLPCNRKFWKKCGDFDSLIQFQECAYRALMNDLSNKQKADSALVLDNYMKLLSAQVHVNLGGFKLPDFQFPKKSNEASQSFQTGSLPNSFNLALITLAVRSSLTVNCSNA